MGGKLDTDGGCGRGTLSRQSKQAGGGWVRHHNQVSDVAIVESHILLLHGELDAILLDACLLQNLFEPTKSSGAVQLVGLLGMDKKLSSDLLDPLHLRVIVRKASAKVRE